SLFLFLLPILQPSTILPHNIINRPHTPRPQPHPDIPTPPKKFRKAQHLLSSPSGSLNPHLLLPTIFISPHVILPPLPPLRISHNSGENPLLGRPRPSLPCLRHGRLPSTRLGVRQQFPYASDRRHERCFWGDVNGFGLRG